jgi:multimeric flavodoxin WrbA
MQSKGLILQASSRSDGNTRKIVSRLQKDTNYDVIDLAQLRIEHFDYKFKNQDDDFSALIKNIANNYETIIFATPVYWYSMSGLLKVFLDRISDCLIIDKETGRKLRGKSLGLVICGSQPEETIGFDTAIKSAAEYLGMGYLGYVHTWVEDAELTDSVKSSLKSYSEKVQQVLEENR